MSARLVAVGDQDGIREHEKCCPRCGRFGLRKDGDGPGHVWISGGEVCFDEITFYSCPACGYEGDGELEKLPDEEPENCPFDEVD